MSVESPVGAPRATARHSYSSARHEKGRGIFPRAPFFSDSDRSDQKPTIIDTLNARGAPILEKVEVVSRPPVTEPI